MRQCVIFISHHKPLCHTPMRITVKLWAEKSKKCFGIRFEALIASAGRRHNKKINTVNQKSIIMSTIKVSPRPFERTFISLFEDLFQHLPAQEWGQRLATDTVPVNIRETKDGYVLDVVAPGFEKQDFKISMEGELLTLSAERKQESKTAEERFLKREFSFKSFSRSFRMDDQIDRSAITAKYEQGILQLTLPKKEEVKLVPREINVL
jgi:HSP20 family protein